MTDHAAGRREDADVYDWWSRHPRLLDRFYTVVFFGREASIRRRAVEIVLVPLFERLTDWMPDVDLPAGVGDRFAETAVETYTDGTLFVASATKGEGKK